MNTNYHCGHSSCYMGKNEPDEWVDIEVEGVVRAFPQDKAVLFLIEGEEVWIPKSLIEDVDLVVEPPWGVPQTIAIKRWFARKENIPTLED